MSATRTLARSALRTAGRALLVGALALAAAAAAADPAAELRADFARSVYRHSAAQVHDEHPQPLLRAVVVLRIRLDETGRFAAEVFRDNPTQPAMTRAALASVARLPPPIGLDPAASRLLRGEGIVEAWLFENDGRFALRTLAKPQRGA